MIGDEVPVDLDAEAGLRRQLDNAVVDVERVLDELLLDLVVRPVVLDDRRVRGGGDDVEVRGDRERVGERVRNRVQMMRSGENGDPLRLADAPAA